MKHLLDTLKWWVPWLFERDKAVAVASEAPTAAPWKRLMKSQKSC